MECEAWGEYGICERDRINGMVEEYGCLSKLEQRGLTPLLSVFGILHNNKRKYRKY